MIQVDVSAVIRSIFDYGALLLDIRQMLRRRTLFTVLFRVNRIKKLLYLDPLHNDADRETLSLLYMYSKVKQITSPS